MIQRKAFHQDIPDLLASIIEVIRKAKDPNAAREGLRGRAWPMGVVKALIERVEEKGRGGIQNDGASYRLSDEQAKAILELRLQRLTGLERDKIAEEIEGLINEIGGYLQILGIARRDTWDAVLPRMRVVRDRIAIK